MSSLTNFDRRTDEVAIAFDSVSKHYKLAGSKRGFFRHNETGEAPQFHTALNDLNFSVRRGERIGLIGRNGAGKTTLLKLIAGNHKPTSGAVTVNGEVQALMSIGYGFHQEQTGLENIRSALRHNALDADALEQAIEDIIDFCELGNFLHQPFKTYSTGMQSRLMFACATAIKPDILIVDEILGAGDAYFTAKSKLRVQNMVSAGCTMLLVSHSMQQVLELCDRAIWLEDGNVKMIGSALSVVKAYEQNMSGRIAGMLVRNSAAAAKAQAVEEAATYDSPMRKGVRYQAPPFIPHAYEPVVEKTPDANFETLESIDRSGLSRWESSKGVKISGFGIRGVGTEGREGVIRILQPAVITIFLRAEHSGEFMCRCGVAIHDLMDRAITRLWGPIDTFNIEEGQHRRIDILLNPNQLGAGEYRVGISVHDTSPMETVASVRRFDLLARSFSLKVEMPDSLMATENLFYHSSEWSFRTLAEPQRVAQPQRDRLTV